MRRWIFLLLCMMLCFVVSACGSSENISGEVVEVTPTALILETDDGKRIAVLLGENTYIIGMDGMDGEEYKAAPHTGIQISFYKGESAGTINAADGTEVNAYHVEDDFVHIEAYLISETTVLSDGTVLNVWKTGPFGTIYQSEDGIELLREEIPNGPENHYVGNLESFDDLSEVAKPIVAEYYEKQGKLYDLQEELERAWTAYKADSERFSAFVVRQETYPVASNNHIFYFSTDLTLTVSGNVCDTTTICAAFDRETGSNIPIMELFTCPEEDVGRILIDLAGKDGTGPSDPVVKEEMEAAFRIEYLSFLQDRLKLEFPSGTLPSQEYRYIVDVKYNEESKEILQSWAIPNHGDE